MRQMRHIADTKNAFPATTSVPSVPFSDTISAHAMVHTETKARHQVSPHTPPSCRAKRTGRNHVTNVTGISYQNAKNRVSCVSPLTTAKLTRSCAGPNPGVITYTQCITDVSLEDIERCTQLVLEHHKCHKMRTSKARNAGCHAKTSGKEARDLSIGSLSHPRTWSGGESDSRRFSHARYNNRKDPGAIVPLLN